MAQRHPGGNSHFASAAGLAKGALQPNTLARGLEEYPVLALLGLPAAAKKDALSSLLYVVAADSWESEGPGAALNSTRKRTLFSVMPFTGSIVG